MIRHEKARRKEWEMKAVVIPGAIFLSIVFIGLVGYFYVLWTQYTSHIAEGKDISEVHNESETIRQINNNRRIEEVFEEERLSVSQGIIRPPGKPYFPKSDNDRKNGEPVTKEEKQVATHKKSLFIKLRTALHTEGGPFVDRSNSYKVQFKGQRLRPISDARTGVCKLAEVADQGVGMVSKSDEPFNSSPEKNLLFTDFDLLENTRSSTCVIVSSAGAMLHSGLGEFIDSHDVVLRFNHAPTKGYENDVGSKTTVRIVNSQVVSRPKYKFLEDTIFQNIEIVVWDPSLYNANLSYWRSHPDHPFFDRFFQHRTLHPSTPLHLLRPDSLWKLWNFLQTYSSRRLRYNPPSSGFLGLTLLLMRCQTVRIVEFVPSLRETDLCHYYEALRDRSCTYGAWHPLAAEKLMALSMNVANDTALFRQGICEIPGFRSLSC